MEDWLKSIGLEHRSGAFRRETIARDQLAELTESDLKDLGLTIGERRRFRRAVLELRDDGPAPPATLAERRPLTMMFVDLVESSAMGERLEPEDLLEVIRRYREFCGAIIRRYGGSVARQVGDGILAYFSYPLATENDPERAVRAALDIARDIAEVPTPETAGERLQVRVGIATGRVIISDMLAGGQPDLRTIIGSAPNLAARLQGLARPGGVVIARETHERIRDLFACEDLGQIEMRGFAEPRHVWRVLHDLPRARWRPGPQPARLTPFCARGAELAFLGRHWSLATEGAGRAVLVRGEAGIGKSRLIETFLALSCQEDCRVIQLAASACDVDSPLLPFAGWLRGQARADATGDPESVDLAELLGIGRPGNAPVSPAQTREQILAALLERLLSLASGEPLCLLVEDLHWLDPSSLELLGRLVARIGDRRLMLLLSARDDFETPWLTHSAVGTLRLARLGADDVAAMVRGLFEQANLPPHLVGQIVRKSDGVPLFVVELLRGMLQPDRPTVAGEEAEAEIPASLHASLMARLDRAGLAKEVAQVAAVIGRSVRPDILAAVAGRVAAEMEAPLAALVGAGVLYRDDAPVVSDVGPVVSYTFTHALVRDAAYDSLLRDQRQGLHSRVAEALLERDPKATEQQPELLGLHLTEAGRPEDAGPYWIEAARRSLGGSALTEATRLLRRGLAALEKATPNAARTDMRLRVMALLGPALIALKGPGSADAQDMYAGAYQLCQDLPEHPAHVPIYWGWWRMSRDFTGKLDRAEALLVRARLRADDGLLLQAHHCCWASHYCVGSLARSRGHAEAGLAIYAAGDYRDHARLYGNHDAKVCAHGELSEIFWLQGRPLRALAQERAAVAWAAELKHLGSTVHALDYRLMHRACRRDLSDVFAFAGELAGFAAEHALADHHAKALIFRGWSKALLGDTATGLAMLEDGIARQRDIGTDEDFPLYVSLLAEVLIRAGKPDQAVAGLVEARAQFAQIGLRVSVPELVRLLGEATIAADPGAGDAAAAYFVESARLAGEQGASMLGLRSAMSASRLHARRGGADIGARLLAAALAAVAEDDGGADVREAAGLLAGYRQLGVAVEPAG